jgi:hypothetical protein
LRRQLVVAVRSPRRPVERLGSERSTLDVLPDERSVMAFQVGDRVVAESESAARPPRTGKVREVLRGDPTPRYRIEWDDGHTTTYTPAAGALHAPRKRRRVAT